MATRAVRYRSFSILSPVRHENPLGLPRRSARIPPEIPRKGLPQKRPIQNVKRVIAVASGKGGVGKSTVAVNLAFALAMKASPTSPRRRVGILDLDIFGPSIPTLMGLENSEEPRLTESGALVPLTNHGLPCMSMGFLLPRPADPSQPNDTAVVWRGLMVQKAAQQLLFDVDWRDGENGPGLDALVIDMPPGTGDIPLTLGQLVKVDGAIIVSTPQDVALIDVRKGISMFRKVSVPVTGLVLNQSYFIPPSSTTPYHLFGSARPFRSTADRLGVDALAELPLVPGVSASGDKGVPYSLMSVGQREADGIGGEEWRNGIAEIAKRVWEAWGEK